jgi:hypothetical protein
MPPKEVDGYICASCGFWIQNTGDWFCEECTLPTCENCSRVDHKDNLLLCPDCFSKEGKK